MATDLRDKIISALLHDLDKKKPFMPEDSLQRLMNESGAVTKVLEECKHKGKLKRKTSVEDLASFITKDAYKIFAILVCARKPQLIENFYKPGFVQGMLPLKHHEINGQEWVVESQTGETVFSDRDKFPWKPQPIQDFCDTWQWPFVAPVFVQERFRYEFPSDMRLPFTKTWKRKQDGLSQYSEMVAKSIHRKHLRTTLQTALDKEGNPRIALKKLTTSKPEEAEREATALSRLNDFASNHLIRTIAYYRVDNNEHFFMFPWAEKGNLWEFWTRQKRAPKLNRQYMISLFRQLKGLAGALDEMSNDNIRHGDLKPENIVCFEAEDGLPEADDSPVRLVITDVGLARKHVDETEKRGHTDTIVSTKRYAAPELQGTSTGTLSRRFDIWAMGCIFLEFVIWLLDGKEELQKFTDFLGSDKFYQNFKRGETRSGAQRLMVPDQVSGKQEEIAHVHPKVRDRISAIMNDARCSEKTALRSLVNLIDKKMLVVELGNLQPPPLPTGKPSMTEAKKVVIFSASQPGVPGVMTRAPTMNGPVRASTMPLSDTTESSDGRIYARTLMKELEEILHRLENRNIEPVGREDRKQTSISKGSSQAGKGTTGRLDPLDYPVR